MNCIMRWRNLISLLWHMIRTTGQLLYGAWHVFRLPMPIVSIFGGARVSENDPSFQRSFALSNKFVTAGISVLTGGGPGIMQAASCGVQLDPNAKGRALGIGVVGFEDKNKCVDNYLILDHLFARKWLLISYSVGFIVFPGGFGTLDELTELLTSIQVGKLPRVPIVLMGKDYWQPFLDWLYKHCVARDLLTSADLELVLLTDDIDEAFCAISKACDVVKQKKPR